MTSEQCVHPFSGKKSNRFRSLRNEAFWTLKERLQIFQLFQSYSRFLNSERQQRREQPALASFLLILPQVVGVTRSYAPAGANMYSNIAVILFWRRIYVSCEGVNSRPYAGMYWIDFIFSFILNPIWMYIHAQLHTISPHKLYNTPSVHHRKKKLEWKCWQVENSS